MSEEESLIEYPCNFPVKVVGSSIPEFQRRIIEIANRHDPEFTKDKMTSRFSKGGKYQSLTLNIHATSKPQMDSLYQELTDCELVHWAL